MWRHANHKKLGTWGSGTCIFMGPVRRADVLKLDRDVAEPVADATRITRRERRVDRSLGGRHRRLFHDAFGFRRLLGLKPCCKSPAIDAGVFRSVERSG